MAYVIRGSRAYEYRSVRRGGKVTSEYVGGASIPAESARFFRELEARSRIERTMNRADWEAERGRLAEAERRSIETDAAYDEVATVALIASGHHRPGRGRWRRRRSVKSEDDKTRPARPEPITAAEMRDLFAQFDRSEGDEKRRLKDHVCEGVKIMADLAKAGDERALPALRVVLQRRPDWFGDLSIAHFARRAMAVAAGGPTDALIRDVFIREIEARRDELAGPNPSPLELLLCERVAVAWFDASHRDTVLAEAEEGGNCTLTRLDFLNKQRDRATRRFLDASRCLATVRKLALPVLQVSLGMPGGASARVPGYTATVEKCLAGRPD